MKSAADIEYAELVAKAMSTCPVALTFYDRANYESALHFLHDRAPSSPIDSKIDFRFTELSRARENDDEHVVETLVISTGVAGNTWLQKILPGIFSR
jgi:hypothetical protein